MLWETITARAVVNYAHIAVGVGPQYVDKTIDAAEKAAERGLAKVTLVSSRPLNTALDVVVSDRPDEALINLLKDGKVDGLVRGSLGANSTLRSLRRIMGLQKVLRVSLLRAPSGRFFFSPPWAWTRDGRSPIRRSSGRPALRYQDGSASSPRWRFIGRQDGGPGPLAPRG